MSVNGSHSCAAVNSKLQHHLWLPLLLLPQSDDWQLIHWVFSVEALLKPWPNEPFHCVYCPTSDSFSFCLSVCPGGAEGGAHLMDCQHADRWTTTCLRRVCCSFLEETHGHIQKAFSLPCLQTTCWNIHVFCFVAFLFPSVAVASFPSTAGPTSQNTTCKTYESSVTIRGR